MMSSWFQHSSLTFVSVSLSSSRRRATALGLPFLPSDDELAQCDVRRQLLALAEAHAAAGVRVMRLQPVADIAWLALNQVTKGLLI